MPHTAHGGAQPEVQVPVGGEDLETTGFEKDVGVLVSKPSLLVGKQLVSILHIQGVLWTLFKVACPRLKIVPMARYYIRGA